MEAVSLPACCVLDCPDRADPRWFVHGPDGKLHHACDGHGCDAYVVVNGCVRPCHCADLIFRADVIDRRVAWETWFALWRAEWRAIADRVDALLPGGAR